MNTQMREIKFSLRRPGRHSGQDASALEFRKLVEMTQAENTGRGSRKRQCRHKMLLSPLDHGAFKKLLLSQYG